MRENTKVQEKFELSLDGRQIASVVVGALVLLGVVFALGLSVGRQVGARSAAPVAAGNLEELDRAADQRYTFYEQLPRGRPAAPPPPAPASAPAPAAPAAVVAAAAPAGGTLTATVAAPAPAASAEPALAPGPAPAAAEERAEPAVTPVAAPARSAAGSSSAEPSGHAAAPAHPAGARPAKGWCVQLLSTTNRAEADRALAKYKALSPRVEQADLPGKGRYYRVRVGRFAERSAAEGYLKEHARETGGRAIVAELR